MRDVVTPTRAYWASSRLRGSVMTAADVIPTDVESPMWATTRHPVRPVGRAGTAVVVVVVTAGTVVGAGTRRGRGRFLLGQQQAGYEVVRQTAITETAATTAVQPAIVETWLVRSRGRDAKNTE